MTDDRCPPSDNTTLSSVLEALEADGYTGQMSPVAGGLVRCYQCHQEFAGADVTVEAVRRLEGASDPADMMAVVALTCPHCQTRGTLVLHYGPEASPEEADTLLALPIP